MLSLEEIKIDLKGRLSEYRYQHSIRVALEARKLAKYYNVNESDAYLAGILHDVAKEFSDEENRYWVSKYNLSEKLLGDANKKTCHAEIGAVVAKELYGIDDNISQAIKYHTIGNVDMNMLDKIVFVADKIEGGKSYPGIEEERLLAYQNIDDALILCLQNNKRKLENQGKLFDKRTEELLNYLLNKKI